MNEEYGTYNLEKFITCFLTMILTLILSLSSSDILLIELSSFIALIGCSLMVMIKLKLHKSVSDFESVKKLPGLSDLYLDPKFGLIPIDLKNSLYVVRVDKIDNLDSRRKLSPEIIEAYGDVRISTT